MKTERNVVSHFMYVVPSEKYYVKNAFDLQHQGIQSTISMAMDDGKFIVLSDHFEKLFFLVRAL